MGDRNRRPWRPQTEEDFAELDLLAEESAKAKKYYQNKLLVIDGDGEVSLLTLPEPKPKTRPRPIRRTVPPTAS